MYKDKGLQLKRSRSYPHNTLLIHVVANDISKIQLVSNLAFNSIQHFLRSKYIGRHVIPVIFVQLCSSDYHCSSHSKYVFESQASANSILHPPKKQNCLPF